MTSGTTTAMATTDPATALRRLVTGYQVSEALHVAATLGIADLLAEGGPDIRRPQGPRLDQQRGRGFQSRRPRRRAWP